LHCAQNVVLKGTLILPNFSPTHRSLRHNQIMSADEPIPDVPFSQAVPHCH
jgi:hypothetical protein